MTLESHPVWVELTVPGLDHDRNLKLMVSKQLFSGSTLVTRRSLNAAYKQEKRKCRAIVRSKSVHFPLK
jgi:hypothetical protein